MARSAQTTPRWFTAPVVLVSLVASACGGTGTRLFADRIEAGGVSYDPRICVEEALRRADGPDPELLADARAAFSDACASGEAASCSALGVMYELGRGVPMDVEHARGLYARACEGGEARGCANLHDLVKAANAARRENDWITRAPSPSEGR